MYQQITGAWSQTQTSRAWGPHRPSTLQWVTPCTCSKNLVNVADLCISWEYKFYIAVTTAIDAIWCTVAYKLALIWLNHGLINGKSCPLTKLNGGLSRLHSTDEDAVSWLTSYGSWHAYKKKKISGKWPGFNEASTLQAPRCQVTPPDTFATLYYSHTDVLCTQWLHSAHILF